MLENYLENIEIKSDFYRSRSKTFAIDTYICLMDDRFIHFTLNENPNESQHIIMKINNTKNISIQLQHNINLL